MGEGNGGWIWASIGCMVSSCGFLWMSTRKEDQLKAIQQAKPIEDFTGEAELKQEILKAPGRRLYIKGHGNITSDVPISVKLTDDLSIEAVCTTQEIDNRGYFIGMDTNQHFKMKNFASDIYIDIAKSSPLSRGLRIYPSDSLVELAEQDLSIVKKEGLTNSMASHLVSFVGIFYPYSKQISTAFLHNRKNIFFAGDAIEQDNRLKLVPPIAWGHPAFFKIQSEQVIEDTLSKQITGLKTASELTAGVGLIFMLAHYLS
ncbi:uncharacterized protein LOC126315356 [Schistocerca gregaria]|uniref:uncharacterized protein LOC126315356 n=1 Tax=Schistocerca gregaria TaxID=7010 RepID=UPI00211E03C2|nr:uncharacterized protein LOC126315356 [Schistocerca gregaria]